MPRKRRKDLFMDITNLGQLAIVGITLSLLVQWLKNKFDSVHTQYIVVALSILAGIAYFFLRAHSNLLVNCLSILAAADLVYSYLLQYLEKPSAGVPGA